MEEINKAYQYRFKEGAREYQIILLIDNERRLDVVDCKRIAPWGGSSSGETSLLKKIDSKEDLSPFEIKQLKEAGVLK